MKIKTITCHEVYNHGASLQEYALLKYLESIGHEAETIHYKPPYLSNHFNLWRISNDRYNNIALKLAYLILKLPGRLKSFKRKREFDDFSLKYIKSTKKLYRSNEELKMDVPIAEAYMCGSDQIWNSYFENGKDSAFYLDFVPEAKLKISYAASFAIDQLEEKIKPFVYEKVSRLNAISVRETSGKKILESLGVKNVTQVLDPVFLLPEEDWVTTFTLNKNTLPYKYVFVYDFDGNPQIKSLALRIKKDYGYKIITVNPKLNYVDKNFYLSGPEKFLSLIKHSDFVISNSFHAVAFSIIFKKRFIVFNRNEKINTRMRDLLSLFNISHLLINYETDLKSISNISFDINHDLFLEQVKRSKKFIQRSLDK